MDKILQTIGKDYGLLGLILAGVVVYFLRAETVFWREREDFKTRLQKSHDDFLLLMKERIAEQNAAVIALTSAIDKLESKFQEATVEFVGLRELIAAKLEQMQAVQMQRLSNGNGQK